MVVWASILQSTADTRHLYRFTKEIHQKKAESMVFQYANSFLSLIEIRSRPSLIRRNLKSPTFMTHRTSSRKGFPMEMLIFSRESDT